MSEHRRRRRPPIVTPEGMPEQDEAQISQDSTPQQQEQNEPQLQHLHREPQHYATPAQQQYQASYQQQPQYQAPYQQQPQYQAPYQQQPQYQAPYQQQPQYQAPQQQQPQYERRPRRSAPQPEASATRHKTSKRKNEKRLAVCRLHWTKWLVKFIISVILLVLVVGGVNYFKSNYVDETGGNNSVKAIALLCFIGLVSIINILDAIIKYKTTYLALTESKIIGHIGFIKSRTLTTPLSKLQDIGIGNGFWGKVLGYHTITLSSAGSSGTEYIFKHMGKAKKFVDAVYTQIEEIRKNS